MSKKYKGNIGNTLSPDMERVYHAADEGDFHSLRKALQSGAPINFINPHTTDSPLMIACRKGHSEIVRLCLDFGAKNDPHPDFGQTALHAAVTGNQFDCAKILLDIAAASDADYIIANLTDQHSQTPLHSAVLIGSIELTELLLQHGAKISSVDSYGQTPLHICAGSSSEQCLAVLLDHGGDEYIDSIDIYGNTPLHHSAYNGNVNCAKLLLETAANAFAKNSKNLTAYNLATMQGHHQIGVLLLEYKDGQQPAGSSSGFSSGFHSSRSVRSNNSTSNNNNSNSGGGVPITPFSPMGDRYSNSSTPSFSRVDESEFRTPLQYSDLRRNKGLGGLEVDGSSLPRPYTMGSPSLSVKLPTNNNSSNNLLRQTSFSSSSSPVDYPMGRKSFDHGTQQQQQPQMAFTSRSGSEESSSFKGTNEPIDVMDPTYQPAPIQLATPLLSREQSRLKYVSKQFMIFLLIF
jgi:ankyrin repeat protein